MNQILQALVNAQRSLQNLGKDAEGYASSYLTLDKLITATRPALTKNGLVVVQTIEPGETTQTLVTTLYHVSGESLSSRYPIDHLDSKSMNRAQQLGAGVSYARRYSLAAMLNVTHGKEDAECIGPEGESPPHDSRASDAVAAPATAQAAIRLDDCETPEMFSEWVEDNRKKIADHGSRGLARVRSHAEKYGFELPEDLRAA